MTTLDTRIPSNLDEMRRLILAAARLVDELDAIRRREEAALRYGLEIGFGHGYEVGYAHAEHDMESAWKQTSRRIRGGVECSKFAERRAAELEACKPRPNDFPGLDNDPHALDAYRLLPTSLDGDDDLNRRTR